MNRSLTLSAIVLGGSFATLSGQETFQASWDFDGTSPSLAAIINHQELVDNYGTAGLVRSVNTVPFSVISSEDWITFSNTNIAGGNTYVEFELTGLPADLTGLEFASAVTWTRVAGQSPTISGYQLATQSRETGLFGGYNTISFGAIPTPVETIEGIGGSLSLEDFTSISGLRLRINLVGGLTAGANARRSISFSDPSFTGNLTVIPEPSTYAAIFGGLMLGLAFVARRRKARQPIA